MASGQPDWYRTVQPARTDLSPGQSRGYYSLTGTLSANSYSIVKIGTVPSNERWLIGFVSISCNKSGLNRVILTTDEFGGDYEFFDSYYDTNLQVAFTSTGTFPVGPGANFKVWIYNYLDEDAYFMFQVHYTAVKV